VEANIGRSSVKVLTEYAVLVVGGFKLAPRPVIITVLNLHEMDVPLIGWELTGVSGSGQRLVGGAVAGSPLSPLHPALPLNAYLGWTSGKFFVLSVGISVTSIASGLQVVSLCLEGNRQGKSHSGTVLSIDPTGICRFCKAEQSSLPISFERNTPLRILLL